MSSNPIRLKYLFEKYLQNNCSKSELNEFWQLMSQLSENDLVSEEMLALWDKMPPEYQPSGKADKEKIYASIRERAAAQQIDYNRLHQKKRHKPVIRLLKVAAVLFACLALAWWQRERKAPQTAPLSADHAQRPVRQVISLPDGTTAILNSNSKLDYPPVFQENSRDVYLTGEAYFDVQEHAGRPFVVHTGKFTTTVLGTRFNIRNYPAEEDVTVTVASGKVQVSEREKMLGILTRNGQIVADKTSGAVIQRQVDVRQVTAWKRQNLFFKNMTLGEAVTVLNDHYDVTILFRNKDLRHCRFTGTFLSDSKLEQVLDVITTVTDIRWEHEKDTIWLDGDGCTGKE
ncbi:FecR family protein [Chitinophaga cymbidii]|uniref:Anti-sigma factor n=1 Tax=Chitinophaga cymbidii TaxID=1096750 RepID=A0A512RMC2_9BACT|nr:FecR domain-containing protein [Chitinophaga cymbidii]GEP96863.1 anti-sigma factor [Chitinophaga cymbidii]